MSLIIHVYMNGATMIDSVTDTWRFKAIMSRENGMKTRKNQMKYIQAYSNIQFQQNSSQ